MNHRSLILLLSLPACALDAAPRFGEPCNADADCAEPLRCDMTRAACLPPPPPDLRGRTCDDPMPHALAAIGALTRGTTSYVMPPQEELADLGLCGSGRSMVLSLDVPTQLDATGAPRPGMVLRARVDAAVPLTLALADERCGSVAPMECAAAKTFGSNELLLPAVAAGPHRLLVTAAGPAAVQGAEVPFDLTVEQVACPYGFVPDEATCLGFASVGTTTPRVEHTVTRAADGSIFIVGGYTEEGAALDSYEIIRGRTITELGLPVALAEHTATQVGIGPLFLFGGQQGDYSDASSFYFFGPGAPTPSRSYAFGAVSTPRGETRGCVAAGSETVRTVVIACPDLPVAVLAGTPRSAGDLCSGDFSCGTGAICVATEPPDSFNNGRCVCVSPTCGDEAWEVVNLYRVDDPRADLPRSGFFLLPTAEDDSLYVVGGGVNSAGAAARTYLLNSVSFAFHTLDTLLDLPTTREASAVNVGDEGLVCGGRALDGTPSRAFAFFDATSGADPRSGELASARADAALVTIDDTRALIIGGHDGSTALRTSEFLSAHSETTSPGPRLPFSLSRAVAVTSDEATLVVAGQGDSALSGVILELVRTPLGTLDPPAAPPFARVKGDTCEEALPLEGPGTFEGTTFGALAQFDIRQDGGCDAGFSSDGPDRFFSLNIPARSAAEIVVRPYAIADLMIGLFDGCDEGSACIDSADDNASPTTEPERVDVPAQDEARTVFLVVDSYDDRVFDFAIDVTFVEQP